VSGDYYDFLPLGTEKLSIAVGDVSGKGISAALLMATLHSAVRSHLIYATPQGALLEVPRIAAVAAGSLRGSSYHGGPPEGPEIAPAQLLAVLNHQLVASTPMEKYATLFLATYDGLSRSLTYSNAGHLPPMVLSRNGQVRKLESGGTVVGLFDGMQYDQSTIEMQPGDIFLAYSDGVTEPENEFGEFGEERLIELIADNRDLPLDRIAEAVTNAVHDWIGGAEQPDDITVVLARVR
jgi:sigma-B regulation protein RsbU (phosphoserine phosphatase)